MEYTQVRGASTAGDGAMGTRSVNDERWMARALELAARARGWTSPNPMVGAIVVKDGGVVGEGYHRRAGLAHAEVVALDEAGDRARGADLYVTLEPCVHYGRTPPCTDRIIAAKVRRVICPHADPDARVNGRGIAILREAGIEVEVGPGAADARRLNEQYLYWKRTGRPWVTLKWAQTLDGQVATRAGHSKWITDEEARRQAHELRSWHDAVLVGIGTALADDPQLNVRMVEGRQPWHVVLDPALLLPLDARLVEPGQTLLVCRDTTEGTRRAVWDSRGVDVAAVPGSRDALDLDAVMDVLKARPFQSVLVEGGPTIITAFIRACLANRVVIFIAPKILGAGRGAVGDLGSEVIGHARALRETELRPAGQGWRLTGLLAEEPCSPA